MPMSAERFRAFRPGSNEAVLRVENETEAAVDRIAAKMKSKSGQR
jgi:hypothetical protein